MPTNEFKLSYGRGQLQFRVPDGVDVEQIRKPSMPVLSDKHKAVRDAIAHPVGEAPIIESAAGAKSACIVVCDITRPVPNRLFLRPLIEELIKAGLPRSAITILVATGLHRPNEGDELAELIGDSWVLENVKIVNHDARDDAQHVLLGTTPTRGTVVRLNRHVVEADVRIATGLVEPHFMAGYSGGRKVIAPGVAHAETITTFHSARFMADPSARNCNFVNNPLHEEQLEIVRMLGGALAINTVIDEQRNLSFINFGDIVQSHQQAVGFVREFCELPVPERFDTVVTCSAGYPLDKTYYQTVKGMVGAVGILNPGGDLIIASQCSEGLGSTEYAEAQRRLLEAGPEAFVQKILGKTHADIDEWQTQMQTKAMRLGDIYLYTTGLTKQQRELTGVHCTESIEESIANSTQRHNSRRIAVIPEGPYVVPIVTGESICEE